MDTDDIEELRAFFEAAYGEPPPPDDDKVREALVGIEFDAPQGPVKVMPNHHLSQTVRIGQITADGQFEILESTDGPVAPQAWNQFEPSSKGFACDWTDAAKGEKYKL